MTRLSKIQLTYSQMAQILATGFMLMGQYFLLKQEIHDNKVFDTAEKHVINFKLEKLEKCCGVAIKPEEIKLELVAHHE